MPFHVVLVNPDIPQNTGNIARLTAATYCFLHLIEPFGFELSDRYLKRAGLDYWPEVQLLQHKDWEAFLSNTQCQPEQLWLFTTHTKTTYTDVTFSENDFFVFGSETKGLPSELHERYAKQRITIPMDNPRIRSLNLASSVAIAVYEAKRQLAQLNCRC